MVYLLQSVKKVLNILLSQGKVGDAIIILLWRDDKDSSWLNVVDHLLVQHIGHSLRCLVHHRAKLRQEVITLKTGNKIALTFASARLENFSLSWVFSCDRVGGVRNRQEDCSRVKTEEDQGRLGRHRWRAERHASGRDHGHCTWPVPSGCLDYLHDRNCPLGTSHVKTKICLWNAPQQANSESMPLIYRLELIGSNVPMILYSVVLDHQW